MVWRQSDVLAFKQIQTNPVAHTVLLCNVDMAGKDPKWLVRAPQLLNSP